MIKNPVKRGATYLDLVAAPDNMVAELVEGELHLSPRPADPHAGAETHLSAWLVNNFDWSGRGWVIRVEPEIHLEGSVFVPDVAGWRAERFVKPSTAHHTLVPDWVCEISSPSTVRLDTVKKMPRYRASGVAHLWIIDPVAQLLTVYAPHGASWFILRSFSGDDKAKAEPFEDVELDLSLLWR